MKTKAYYEKFIHKHVSKVGPLLSIQGKNSGYAVGRELDFIVHVSRNECRLQFLSSIILLELPSPKSGRSVPAMLYGTELVCTVGKKMVHVIFNENEPARIPKSMQNFCRLGLTERKMYEMRAKLHLLCAQYLPKYEACVRRYQRNLTRHP